MHQGFEEGGPEGAGASQSFIVVPRSLELKQALISYRAIYGVRKLARGCLSLLLMAGLFASYLPANQGNLSGSYTATTRCGGQEGFARLHCMRTCKQGARRARCHVRSMHGLCSAGRAATVNFVETFIRFGRTAAVWAVAAEACVN